MLPSHLQRLEAESIHILREVAASCSNPVMLYSIGKDSVGDAAPGDEGVPSGEAALPAPARRHDLEVPGDDHVPRPARPGSSGSTCIVHVNPDGIAQGIGPVHARLQRPHPRDEDARPAPGARRSTASTRPSAARGATRRSPGPRSASSRSATPSTPGTRRTSARSCGRPTTRRVGPGESIRVFPLSNWTELDIWQYILKEHIPIVPLYFAAERPVVERDGMLDHGGRRPDAARARRDRRGAPRPLPHARLLPADRGDRIRRPPPSRTSCGRCSPPARRNGRAG